MDLSDISTSSNGNISTNVVSVLTANSSIDTSVLPVSSMDDSGFVKAVYACKKCKFTTSWKSSLFIHQKTHTNERPFECPLCGKHFKLKHHLKHHILTHSAIKPFNCNLCGYRTADQRNMQQHKFRMHRVTIKRQPRGRPRMKLPTMVPGSHLDYNQVGPFVDQTASFSPALTSEPLSTPSFHSNSSSPVFQTPSSTFEMPVVSSNRLPWQRLSQSSDTNSLSSFVERSLLDNVNVGALEKNDDVHSKSPENMTPSPESISNAVKEELERASGSSVTKSIFTTFPTPIADTIRRSSLDNNSSAGIALEPTIVETVSMALPSERAIDARVAPWKCKHCDIIFPDNIMYGLHMGCHSVASPYQCNVCGVVCKDKHDFMFHFTIGKHQ